MKRALLFALSLIPAFCLAEKRPELSEETKKQLAALVAANDYVTVVEINNGKFTGACMVHDKVKVVAHFKGRLRTTALFSSVNADINALGLPPRRIEPMPILTAGTYLVIVKAHEIVHSFPGIKVPIEPSAPQRPPANAPLKPAAEVVQAPPPAPPKAAPPFLGRVEKPKPSFNYFIQHYEWAHCAWAVGSMEANYIRILAKNNIQGD